MKRILFITRDYPPRTGGQSRLGTYFVSALRQEFIVDIADTNRCDRLYGKVFKFLFKVPMGFIVQTLVIALVFGIRYDVVIASDGHKSALFASIYGRMFRKKVVFLFHGLDFCRWGSGFYWKIMRLFLQYNHLIICNSQRTRERAAERNVGRKIVVVHPPVDLELFKPVPLEDLKARLTNNGSKKVLLTVSRLVPRKGIDQVLLALFAVKADYLYIIIGDGPERKKIEGVIKERGLKDRVLLLTDVQDHEIVHYYNVCDVFIMTPLEIVKGGRIDYEGFGMAYVEANACGKPVIGTISGGVPEAVKDNYSGILVKENSVPAIKDAISRILSDDLLRERLAGNAREWAATFDVKIQGARYLEAVKDVLV